MAKKAKATKSGKVDGRSKAARAAKSGKPTGTGGNGRDLHLADNGGNEEAVQASFLQHRNRVISVEAQCAIADKKRREVYAEAKSEGFHKKQFLIAAMLSAGPKKEAKVVGEVKDRLQVARWIGHPMGKNVNVNQMDLFADAPASDPLQAAYEDGERVGLAGGTANVPGQYSAQDLSQAWLSGHHKGQATLQKGIKPLEEKTDNVVGPAAGWGTSKAAQA
jgi:uncharacterized protein (UPF0335 family)